MRIRWQLAMAVALFTAVVALNIFRISDPDTWWHLKTGELIWKTLAIPRADPFSYTIAGQAWVSFEWLSQVLFAAVFASFIGPRANLHRARSPFHALLIHANRSLLNGLGFFGR